MRISRSCVIKSFVSLARHSGETRNPAPRRASGQSNRFVIPAKGGIQRLGVIDKVRIQIMPVRICLLNQLNLPGSLPFLDGFLAQNCGFHRLVHFEPDECMDSMLFREAFDCVSLVFVHALDQIRCYAGIESGRVLRSPEDTRMESVPLSAFNFSSFRRKPESILICGQD